MKRLVHFMVRDPDDRDAIIYPTQLRQPEYVGFGEFYLLGMDAGILYDSYVFPAIKDESVVAIVLRRTARESRLYLADVPHIGSFTFQAYYSRNPARYAGGDSRFDGTSGVRILKPRKPKALDDAVRQFNFYFAGYSPLLADDFDQ